MKKAQDKYKETPDQEPTSVPQVPPVQNIGYGHPEYNFVQSIMEMQKSITQVQTSLQHLTTSVEGVKTKVDDLIKWKNMILGGAVVLGALLTTAVYLANKASEYLTIGLKNQPANQEYIQPQALSAQPVTPPINANTQSNTNISPIDKNLSTPAQ